MNGYDDDKLYDVISQTEPELAYQIFLTAEMVDASLCHVQGKRNRTLAKYAWMTVFALVVKAFQTVGRSWQTPGFTAFLERQWHDDMIWQSSRKHWDGLVTVVLAFLHPIYRKEAAAYYKREGEELTLANFFKSVSYMNKLMRRPLPRSLLRSARQILLTAKV